MRFCSTRDAQAMASIDRALATGLAPDGGLFVSEKLPLVQCEAGGYLDVAGQLLAPFFAESTIGEALSSVTADAFDFPLILKDLAPGTSVLELFHGPSAAFKDFGARFLASCLSKLNEQEAEPVTILVATSGDTGGAVASAFWRKPKTNVIVLFPRDGVSERQRHQLTCWDQNITSFAVDGVFDDCQRMVKEAFSDPWWSTHYRLSSANSINIGRLLPQMTYYAWASLTYRERHGREASFVIPTGNLGNGVACIWAKEMGFPIQSIALAVNANKSLLRWAETGTYRPAPSVSTLANAMDVGAPSNMERLLNLYPTLPSFLRVCSIDDETIKATIAEGLERWGEVFCPHTACAMAVRQTIDEPDWVVVSTAHPSKFETIVEPLVGRSVAMPENLARLLTRPTCEHPASTLADIRAVVAG